MTDTDIDFFKDLVKELKDEDTHIALSGTSSGEFTGYIDTGSYALNALISGSIFSGIPNTKRVMFAGESSTGKCARGSELIRVVGDSSNIKRLAEWLDAKLPSKDDPLNIPTNYFFEQQFESTHIYITYRELFEYAQSQARSTDNIVNIEKLQLFVLDPNVAPIPILEVIKKDPTKIIRVEFDDDSFFECSAGHHFSERGLPRRADEVEVVDSLTGERYVKSTVDLGEEETYDIQVPAPHWYVSPNGLIHHNTFFALSVVKELLLENPKSGVVYYDSESALTKQMLIDRGIDASRVIIVDVDTVQKLRTHILRFVRVYMDRPAAKRAPMIMVIDSLGNLSTSKEVGDIEDGKDTRDMTRAQLMRGLGRSVTIPLAKAKIPLIINNHTYAATGLFPTQELSGGGGAKYVSDAIVFLSKSQDKNAAGVHLGVFITARMFKSRFSKEKSAVKLKLSFSTGLDRYYGLLDIAEKGGLVKCTAKKYTFEDGTSAKESVIYNNPEKYFTPEFLAEVDKAAQKLFMYGSATEDEDDEDMSEVEIGVDSIIEE